MALFLPNSTIQLWKHTHTKWIRAAHQRWFGPRTTFKLLKTIMFCFHWKSISVICILSGVFGSIYFWALLPLIVIPFNKQMKNLDIFASFLDQEKIVSVPLTPRRIFSIFLDFLLVWWHLRQTKTAKIHTENRETRIHVPWMQYHEKRGIEPCKRCI